MNEGPNFIDENCEKKGEESLNENEIESEESKSNENKENY